MSPTPGVTVASGSSAPSTSPPTDTGTWFVAGETEKGPTNEAVLIRSLAQYVSTFGGRVSYGYLYDALETFFKEGGARAYVTRVVGPSPVIATITAKNGSSENALKITATSAGEWGNEIDVVVVGSGSTRVYEVKYAGVVVETSPALETNAEAVAWAANSAYVRFEDLGKGLAAAGTKELASGADDRANITEEGWKTAINRCEADLGPGQVSMPGRTTATAQENLLTHAKERNRVAVLDGADSATVGTQTAQAATLRAQATARYGGLFAPWVKIPGLTGGTTRTVPPCALIAGLAARSDAASGNPNEAIAGVNNVARYVTDLSQAAWTATQRGELSEGGVNVLRVINGAVVPYDDVTLVNAVTDDTWEFLSNARLNMAIAAGFYAVGERHLFAQIDGRGIELGKFNADLKTEVLVPLYEAGALFGDTFQDAVTVDTSEAINTKETKDEGKILAAVSARMSPAGRFVEITLVKEAL